MVLQNLIDKVYEQILQLLTTEWLVDTEDRGCKSPCVFRIATRVLNLIPADRRTRELVRIRQIYIPELIIRLHFILFESRQYIPQYV